MCSLSLVRVSLSLSLSLSGATCLSRSLSCTLACTSLSLSSSLASPVPSRAFSSPSRFPSSQPLYIGVAASRAYAPSRLTSSCRLGSGSPTPSHQSQFAVSVRSSPSPSSRLAVGYLHERRDSPPAVTLLDTRATTAFAGRGSPSPPALRPPWACTRLPRRARRPPSTSCAPPSPSPSPRRPFVAHLVDLRDAPILGHHLCRSPACSTARSADSSRLWKPASVPLVPSIEVPLPAELLDQQVLSPASWPLVAAELLSRDLRSHLGVPLDRHALLLDHLLRVVKPLGLLAQVGGNLFDPSAHLHRHWQPTSLFAGRRVCQPSRLPAVACRACCQARRRVAFSSSYARSARRPTPSRSSCLPTVTEIGTQLTARVIP